MPATPVIGTSKQLHRPDKKLISAVLILLIFGLVMLFSASSVAGYLRSGNSLYFLEHQLLGLLFGIPAFIFCSRTDYHFWKKYALQFFVISIGLLLLVFIPGLAASYGKAHNWINIFGLSFQPAEFVKISFLLYLAAWLEVKKDKLGEFSEGLGPFLAVLGIIGFFMLLQPDLGTFAIIAISSLIIYYAASGRMKDVLLVLALAVVGLAVIVGLKSNKMERIQCYLHPEVNASSTCYQVNQSLIAIGSGGLWGRGLGQSRQKFMYLPEVWDDSIFAVIAEEIGFLFCVLLIGLFVYLFYRGYRIARAAPDMYGQLLALGIVSWVAVQALINIGGATNLIPMTGVPLPFISSGGSALLALLAGIGILTNISRQTR